MESNLLYSPLNIIRGISKAGDIAEERWASLNKDPVQKPILLPTMPTLHSTNTKYKISFTIFDKLLESCLISINPVQTRS